MKNKELTNISVVITCLGLSFLALHFHSVLCGIGAFLAFLEIDTNKK